MTAIHVITARPSSLRLYAAVGHDAAEDVDSAGTRVESAVDSAIAGAVDVPISVDIHGLLGDVAQLLDGTATAVEGVADAFEQADTSGADVLSARDAAIEARLPDASTWDMWVANALGVMAHPATRGSMLAAGTARMGQMWRAAGQFIDAWVERVVARTMGRVTGAVMALPYRMVFRFGRGREIAALGRSFFDPDVRHATNRMNTAADTFRQGRGVIRTLGRVAAPVAAVADATVLIGGSEYDGARGTTDRVMAGVGLVGAGALALSATPLAPIAAPVALIAGTAALAWGVGNLVYDNWDSIKSTTSNIASNVASTVTSTVSSGIRSVGRVFGFGG